MNDAPLPDDLSRWPSDPYELLGLVRGCSPKELKRSYTRLIRFYKPEHYPEAFRKIRDAYEQLQRYQSYFPTSEPEVEASDAPRFTANATDSDPLNVPATERETDRGSDTSQDEVAPPFTKLEPQETVDSLWRLAVAGKEVEAYLGLLRLHERTPHHAAIAVRLYWLLQLNRNLDEAHEPADWLVEAVIQNRLLGSASELYRRHLEWYPEEALSERFDRVLRCDAPRNRFVEVLGWRWQAALRLERWSVIEYDRKMFRSKVELDDREGWLQLILQVIHETAWYDDPRAVELYQSCRAEFLSHDDLALRRQDWFDRREQLEALVKGWRRLKKLDSVGPDFLNLIREGWIRPGEATRSLRSIIEKMHEDHVGWLENLREIGEAAPYVLAHFGSLLRGYEYQRGIYDRQPADMDAVAAMVREIVMAMVGIQYPMIARRMVKLLTRLWIHPDYLDAIFTDWIGGQPDSVVASLATRILSDWPLRYVCWAERLFWQ